MLFEIRTHLKIENYGAREEEEGAEESRKHTHEQE